MKVCYTCGIEKDEGKFPKSRAKLSTGEVKKYVERTCYSCKSDREYKKGLEKDPDFLKKKAEYKYQYNKNNPDVKLYWNSKSRAKKKGYEFNLDKEDVQIPNVCPLLGIPFQLGIGYLCDGSPSVDRIDSTKGYIKGNVWVISHKANTIKSNATLEELEMLVVNLRKKINDTYT